MINKDEVKGKIREEQGSAERHISQANDDVVGAVEGAVKEVAGKVQKDWGKTKDAVEDAIDPNVPPRRP